MESMSEVQTLKKRLKKAVHVAERLKMKYSIQEEVSRELARRNETLKAELKSQEQLISKIAFDFFDLDQHFQNSTNFIGDSVEFQSLHSKINSLKLLLPQSSLNSPTVKVRNRRMSMIPTVNIDNKGLRRRSEFPIMAFVSPVPCESNTNALMSPGSIYSPSLELSPTFTQVSSYSPADSLSSPIPDFDNKMSLHLNETIDLFEHFIVVGAPPTVAHKFANKLKEVDDSSLSRRLMKTVGSLLSSSSKDKPSLSFTSPLPLKTPIKRNNDNNQNIINGDIGIETPSKHNIEEVGRTGISSVFSRKPSFKTTSVAETPQPFDDAEPRTARLQDLSANESISLHTNIASSEATILFRYPQSVEPPPPEIIDFCLPVGAKIHHISGVDENISTIQEILYGHSQSKRTGRCFIFTLDDKTVTESERENTNTNYETGVGTGRLYGVCVIHSRLLAATESGNYSQSNSFEFESLVCYAFLTRFPFFDFFFQVIFDLITLERLERMEKLVSYLENDETEDVPINSKTSKDYHSMFSSDRRVYEYSPVDTLEKVLERLSSCKVPRYGEQMNFSVGSSLLPIEFKRFHLDYDQSLSEHEASAISWALPTLFSWMPIDLIVTTIGLLMCEVKVIIVGFEPGLISCAVFGLLELIKPLNWLTPMIPILPKKYLDFVESPVPILAGLVIDEFVLKDEVASKLDVFDVAKRHASEILKKSNDVENGGITAILNMQVKDIFVSSCHSHILQEVILPGINGLVNKLTASLPSFPLSSSIVGKTTTNVLNRNEDSTLQSPNSWTLGVASLRLNRTLFTPTIQQQLEVKQALCIMSDHIKGLCAMSNAFYKVDIKTSHKVTGIFETVTEVEESCDKEESEFFGREEELSKHENVLESSNTINSSINFTPKVMNCDDVILFSEHIIPYLSNDIDSLLGPRQFQLFIDRFIKTQMFSGHLQVLAEEELHKQSQIMNIQTSSASCDVKKNSSEYSEKDDALPRKLQVPKNVAINTLGNLSISSNRTLL